MKPKELFSLGFKYYRCIFLSAIMCCVVMYIMISTFIPYDNLEYDTAMGYFVNTTGCHMLAMHPLPPASVSSLQRLEYKKCTKPQFYKASTEGERKYLIRIMTENEIRKSFSLEDLSDVTCMYMKVERYLDDQNTLKATKKFQIRNEKTEVDNDAEILRTQCKIEKTKKTIYHDVHFFLPAAPPDPIEPNPSLAAPDHLSVMILGIDSISHMHYIRSMPLLNAYIQSLPHVEFWGFNRVGRNSFPNLVPLLTGLSENELNSECFAEKIHYDDCYFLWNAFKDAGFTTFYGEDSQIGGLFNYDKPGFYNQPTDFYLRPVMVEIDAFTRYSIDQREFVHCSAGRKYGEILHEYMHELVPQMKQGPSFSFFWETQGVHDYFNYAQFLDRDYMIYLLRLKDEGILNHTLVLLMSDHGARFGSFRNTYEGMLEESQPFLIALYPEWLEKKYPRAIKNLRQNAHSLVTTFDLHATLKDLTDYMLLGDKNIEYRTSVLEEVHARLPRGISLFLPIPDKRDCDMACIPSAYCLCHTLSLISIEDERAQRAAIFIVKVINSLIAQEKNCQTLQLNRIDAAYVSKQDLNEYEFEVKVRLVTVPGEGQFEGTTRITGDSMALSGVVLRTNEYGGQAYCIKNYRIEMYCYCYDNVFV